MMHISACSCVHWPHKPDNICMAASCLKGLHQDKQTAHQLRHDLNHHFQHAKACSWFATRLLSHSMEINFIGTMQGRGHYHRSDCWQARLVNGNMPWQEAVSHC